MIGNASLLGEKSKMLSKLLIEDINNDDLKNWILRIKFISICEKLHSFLYHLLLGGLITNIHLERYGLKETNDCSFCELKKETLTHLLWQCQLVQDLWVKIEKIYCIKLILLKVLTNVVVKAPRGVENCIILICKFYIYRTRCLRERLSLKACKNFIEQYRMTEEQIALNKGKLEMQIQKWSLLNDE